MAKVAVLIADGFEEIEAVTIIDVLRRAGLDVTVAGLGGDTVLGAHGIRIHVDTPVDRLSAAEFDAVVLPGGHRNAEQLRDDARVQTLVRAAADSDKFVAAICAAPIALERAGVLEGKQATCYPGYELPSAEYSNDRVVEDGRLVTSRGPGTAMEFSLALVRRLVGHAKATDLRQGMLVKA
ncbi:MAG: DJ-1/PfpI family protein [Polyangiaceae bacterium]|nr:DJ-1/PfpI family protein [Polyangiaceae bacterium]